MEQQTIMELINGVGFPITVCVALFWLVLKNNDMYTQTIEKLRSTIDHNTEILNEVLHQLKDKER